MAAIGSRPLIRRAEPVMGTVVSFAVNPGEVEDGAVYLALARARAVLHKADAVFSTWKPNSPVSRLRRGEITMDECPPEVSEVFHLCGRARSRTGGWFDPWALDGGWDPTGLVKGWAAQRALDAIMASGVAGAMVAAGGDIAIGGESAPAKPWRIGVQDPFDQTALAAVAEPRGAIATSGCYERGHHIVDPHTGRPVAAVASATVTGPHLDMADALATALVAGGIDALASVPALRAEGYEVLLIGHDGVATVTEGFPFAPPAPEPPAAPVSP